MRSVTITVTSRCPLRCRHCAAGCLEPAERKEWTISRAELETIIKNIDRKAYQLVIFSGGEPALEPDLLEFGINACREAGIPPAILTTPIWAATPGRAEKFLDRLKGLRYLFLSYDYFHLEFLEYRQYENAVRAAARRRILVCAQMCYTREQEKQELLDSLTPLKRFISMTNTIKVVLKGSAANQEDIAARQMVIRGVEDLEKVPRTCRTGQLNVNMDMDNYTVGACGWAAMIKGYPFYFSAKADTLGAAFRELESNPVFQAVRKKGFIGSLSRRGKEMLVDTIKGRPLICECDLCMMAQEEKRMDIWNECVNGG